MSNEVELKSSYQDLFNYLEAMTGKVYLVSEMQDLINFVHKHYPGEAPTSKTTKAMKGDE